MTSSLGLPLPRRIAYGLMFTAAVLVVWLDLGPALLAGLIAYMILNATGRGLFLWLLQRSLRQDAAERERGKIGPFPARVAATGARLLSVAVFVAIALLMTWAISVFFRLALLRMPLILAKAIPRLDALADSYGFDLPLNSLEQARVLLITKLKENSNSLTHASGFLTRRFFQVFIGIFAAVSFFWNSGGERRDPNLFEQVTSELGERFSIFMVGFEKIFGAQVAISFINMWVTVVFLRTLEIPYIPFLALSTFIFGLLPIVGNLISNTIIVGTALTVSTQSAVLALGLLIVTHKAEYFLNSRIVGSQLDTPMWQVLLGVMIGEALVGVPGVVLAPAVLHYVREEARSIRLESR
ncbi:MAG: AI-2E family transporter [Elusimicrobia bacterium]|nr:AI-2E family transporter [Elusimicrobiota bacterium]